MPTYDYECENGHSFEAFQSMKDAALDVCPQCGGKATRRIGTGAGFIFKGGGFYITENRSKEYKDKAKSESPGKSESSVKSESAPKSGDGGSAAGSEGSGAKKDSSGGGGKGGAGGAGSAGAGGSSASGGGSSKPKSGGESGT